MSLPRWDPGTPGWLVVAGLHAIPISTAVRAGDRRIVFALGRQRGTLARLRGDPRAAFCLMGRGVAFTAHGSARIVGQLRSAPVIAVELTVAGVQDHLADGRTEMLNGPEYRWRDEQAAAAEPRIMDELARMGAAPSGDEAAHRGRP
jgi:hypothetical protein